MTELKPCPFCGSDVQVERKVEVTDGATGCFYCIWTIKCTACVNVSKTVLGQYKLNAKGEFIVARDGYNLAAEAWNRRVSDV